MKVLAEEGAVPGGDDHLLALRSPLPGFLYVQA
jgi:hypothetical protein